jgi:peptidoglycan/LPS O-acetylase OafA/YrhL
MVALVILGAAFLAMSKFSGVGAISFYSSAGDGIFIEFFLGVGLGLFYLRKIHVPHDVAVLSIIIGLTLIIFPLPIVRNIGTGIAALLVVFGVLYLPSPSNPKLAQAFDFLGCTSYALYLSHLAVLSAIRRIVINLHLVGAVPAEIYIPATVAVSMLIAAVIYMLIEKPLAKYLGAPLVSAIAQRRSIHIPKPA